MDDRTPAIVIAIRKEPARTTGYIVGFFAAGVFVIGLIFDVQFNLPFLDLISGSGRFIGRVLIAGRNEAKPEVERSVREFESDFIDSATDSPRVSPQGED